MSHDSSLPGADQARDTQPWYRQFWPWFLILLPACAVVGGIATVIIAVKNADDVVADDWYKQGRAINRSMEEEQLANRLGLAVQVAATGNNTVQARITSTTPIPFPDTLTVTLRHPTLAERDRTLTLQQSGEGIFAGEGKLGDGDWDITISPDAGQWRLYQRVTVTGDHFRVGAPH